MRQSAEDPAFPGVRIETPDDRELRAVLKQLPFDQLRAYALQPPFESRLEIIQSDHATPIALLFLAGDLHNALVAWRKEAVRGGTARQGRLGHGWLGQRRTLQHCLGRIHRRASSLRSRVGVIHSRVRRFPVALEFALGPTRSAHGFRRRLAGGLQRPAHRQFDATTGYRKSMGFRADPRRPGLFVQPNQSTRTCPAAILVVNASIKSGAGWTSVYGGLACDAASTLWFLNRTDAIEIVEENIRTKLAVPDFRYPMRDTRLSHGSSLRAAKPL